MTGEPFPTDLGALGLGDAKGPASPEVLVDALGMAYATTTLYDDPRSEAAFARAVDTLGRAPEFPWRVEVGVDGFMVQGEPIAVRRDGSLRLSRGLFGMGIAALDLHQPPDTDDLYQHMRLASSPQPPEDARAELEASGVTAVRLLDRALLHDSEITDDPVEQIAAVAVEDEGPAGFIRRMLDDRADPETVAARFVEEYERAHLLVDLDDAWGEEELVHAFADGFWFLPEAHRAAVFSAMLERRHRQENTVFLDQFGSTELAELNRLFGTDGHPLLTDYLRVAAVEGGRHQDDLESLVSPAGGAAAERIVGQVASVLHSSGGSNGSDTALQRLAGMLPDDGTAAESIGNVLATLLSLAEDDEAAARATSLWAGRVAAALTTGDLASADRWIAAATGLNLAAGTARSLVGALAQSMTGQAVDTAARLLTGPEPAGPGGVVRKSAPLYAADGLVAELAAENHVGRRKTLLKALQVVARLRPEAVVPHLADDRWFVVRNVVLALGTSRRDDVTADIEPFTRHGDARVRLEAMRAMSRLGGGSCAEVAHRLLMDQDPVVGAEAARLLAEIDDPAIDEQLVEVVRSGSDLASERGVLALGKRHTATATRELKRLAAKWPASGRHKVMKKLARKALEARDV